MYQEVQQRLSIKLYPMYLQMLRLILKDLKVFLPSPPLLHCDNVCTIALCSNPIFHTKIKHLKRIFILFGREFKKGIYKWKIFLRISGCWYSYKRPSWTCVSASLYQSQTRFPSCDWGGYWVLDSWHHLVLTSVMILCSWLL